MPGRARSRITHHASRITYPGFFVTGTDTGVGKSVVAAGLAAALRRRGLDVGVMKPVQSGAVRTPAGLLALDARFLATVAGVDDPMELIAPVRLEAALAPSVAAELEGREVSVPAILDAYRELAGRHAALIVEGAGGLCVPLTASYLMSDLARDMDLPLLVVARPSLGTINHTVLTVYFARDAGLPVLGVVINDYPMAPGLAERTSPAVIERLAGVPVLGLVPHDPHVNVDSGEPGEIVSSLQENRLLDRLVALLSSEGVRGQT